MHRLHLQVIRTADDDGSKSGTITADQVVPLVQKASEIFADAGVEFIYDPAKDFTHINSTLLNQTYTPLEIVEKLKDPATPPRMSDVPNTRTRMRLAEIFPDRVVVYFSWKTKWKFDTNLGHWVVTADNLHSSAGLGWYVGMCTTASGTSLAHELGHFLQNRHTFGSRPESIAEAAAAIKKYVDVQGHPKNLGAKVFDGDDDWVTDTPPDPGQSLFKNVTGNKCGSQNSVAVPVTFADATTKTFQLGPDRTNLMSYFQCTNLGLPVRLSTEQAWRVKDTVETGLRNRLIAPRAGKLSRVLTRKGSGNSNTQVDSTSIVALGAGRTVTAVRNGSGDLELDVWDLGSDGASVVRRDTATAGTVLDADVCYCGLGIVATAVKTANNMLKVILWKVNPAGSITRKGDLLGDGISATPAFSGASVCRVGMQWIVTAFRAHTGDLTLTAWHVTASGEIARHATAAAGDVTNIAIAESWPLKITDDGTHTLNYGQFTTSFRDGEGKLKLIHWAIDDDGKKITRLTDVQAGAVIDNITLCPLPPRTLISAVRGSAGELRLISWAVNDDGLAIDKWDSEGAGGIHEIATCPAGIDLFATAVRDSGGSLKVIVWRSLAGGAEIMRFADESAGGASRISVCQAGPGLLATALKDNSGHLKVIAWKLG